MKKGWEWKRLGDVCQIRGGGTPSKSETSFWRGHIPWVSPKDMKCDVVHDTIDHISDQAVRESTTSLVPAGSLLVVVRSGILERIVPIAVAGRELALNQDLKAICPSPHVDERFLFFFLHSQMHVLLSKVGRSATVHKLNTEHLRELQIPIPPLPEQQRIVGILDEAFAGLATAEANAARNLQNAREIFDSHLHAVFSQRGEGWVETTIGDLGRVSMCKRIFKQETSATGDIPFYKIGTFGREPDAYIQSETYNQYRAKYPFPKKGDVLISAAGTIGRRVRYDGEPAYFQDSNIVWIDNDEERVLNDYLYHFYGSCQWNCTTGATISRLYNDDLRAIALAFPVSHQQQRHIVEKLDALAAETQRLTWLCEQKQAALAALKASLLHCAFSGEL